MFNLSLEHSTSFQLDNLNPQKESALLCLPNEILCQILSYLPVSNLCRLRMTCLCLFQFIDQQQLLIQVINESNLPPYTLLNRYLKHIKVEEVNEERRSSQLRDIISVFFKYSHAAQQKLFWSYVSNQRGVYFTLSQLPNQVRTLNLSPSRKRLRQVMENNPAFLENTAKKCKRIKELILSPAFCHPGNPYNVEALVNLIKYKDLTYLELDDNAIFQFSIFQSMKGPLMPTLQKIKLVGISYFKLQPPLFLQPMHLEWLTHCPNVKILHFKNYLAPQEAILRFMATVLDQMHSLYVSDIELSTTDVVQIVNLLPNLRYLNCNRLDSKKKFPFSRGEIRHLSRNISSLPNPFILLCWKINKVRASAHCINSRAGAFQNVEEIL